MRLTPICDAMIAALGLPKAHTRATVVECQERSNHTIWYWGLLRQAGLSQENAYAIAVAMHADFHIPFNESTCMLTSD